MPTFTDAEKNQTVAEYLGITGATPTDILAKVEKEIENDPNGVVARKLRAVLLYAPYTIDSGKQSQDGAFYPYVIRALMYEAEKDGQNRLVNPTSRTKARTIGDLINNKGLIEDLLTEQEGQIEEDYKDQKKKRKFLNAINPDRNDMSDKEFFFRFWRSPMKKTFDYKAINDSNEGRKRKEEILKELYGSSFVNIDTLSSKTPEYLVEERVQIENERDEKLKEAKDKPLFEFYNIKFGTRFPDNPADFFTDGTHIGDYSTPKQLEAAREYLRKLLNLDQKNTPDWGAFMELSQYSETNILANKQDYKSLVIQRLDELWIEKNMTRTFGKFIKERRGDIIGDDDPDLGRAGTVARVLNSLKPTPAPGEATEPDIAPKDLRMGLGLGKGLIEQLSDLTLTEIQADWKEIRQKHTDSRTKRIIRRSLLLGGIVSTLLAGATLFMSGEKQPDKPSRKALTEERAKTPAQKAQDTPSTNMLQTLAAATNGVSHTEGTATNGVSTAENTATNGVQNVPSPKKETKIIGKKGNHLIGLRWTGYKDIDHHIVMKEAPDLVFKTFFDYMNAQIQETGLPFGDHFKPEYTRRVLSQAHDYVWLKPVGSKEKIKFYIQPNGRERDEITEDLLSFLMNCRDVLQSLPVASTNLPAAQTKVMTALGPAMGWSTKQQMAWQQRNQKETESASEQITKMAQEAILDQKINVTNDLEAVFMETVKAAGKYREEHPDNKALLLTVDAVTRSIAQIGKENMEQYDKLQTEAHKHIEMLHKIENTPMAEPRTAKKVAERRDTRESAEKRASRQSEKSSGFPWKTTAAVGVIAYLWGRKKRRGG